MLFNNMAYLPIKSGRQPNIERLQKVDRVETYAKLKEDPSPNVLKVIRFVARKKTVLTETISPDCKVLVGMMNLWEEK